MTTTFSNKCEIIGRAYGEWAGDDFWQPIFTEYDLGFAFAFGVDYDMLTLNDTGVEMVEKAWSIFCNTLGIDPYGEYMSLDEMVEFSE